jgi:membrane protease YdiL (CAAX protease family)
MGLYDIFFNEFGRLRSGLRLVFYFLAFIAASLLLVTVLRAGFVVGREIAPSFPYAGFLAEFLYRLSMLAAALGTGYFCVRLLEGLPWRSLGMTLHEGWLRDLVIGSGVGFAALALAVGIAAVPGGLKFSFAGGQMLLAVGKSLVSSTVLFFVAALAEEAAFRGYGLQTLTRAKLVWFGVLLTSLPFGVVHLMNPNVVPVVTFSNTVLAGVWLAITYLRTRSLWCPLGVHFGWNWALGWFFGLPVSGVRLVSNSLFQGEDAGPKWLTGGSYGIEGGVASTIAMVVFTLFIWRTRWLSATPELLKLTSEENPATPSAVVTIRPQDNNA